MPCPNHNMDKVCKEIGCRRLGKTKGVCKSCNNSGRRSRCGYHYNYHPSGGKRNVTKGRKTSLYEQHPWCYYCGRRVYRFRDGRRRPDDATVDHKVPASKGGRTNKTNLVLSCRECNEEKGEMTEKEFKESTNELQKEKPTFKNKVQHLCRSAKAFWSWERQDESEVKSNGRK